MSRKKENTTKYLELKKAEKVQLFRKKVEL